MGRWHKHAAGMSLSTSLMAAALAGCAGPPPPPPPTVVNITLKADASVNPTPQGQGAPVSMRIYQLGSAVNFGSAEFFPLYKDDATILKTDLIKREDLTLAPGQTKTDKLTPDSPVKAIGFFAGYRDFQQADWRGSAEIPPHQTTNITVTAGRSGITVKAETLPPSKPGS
jgi:type VI secretion system protein VasD